MLFYNGFLINVIILHETGPIHWIYSKHCGYWLPASAAIALCTHSCVSISWYVKWKPWHLRAEFWCPKRVPYHTATTEEFYVTSNTIGDIQLRTFYEGFRGRWSTILGCRTMDINHAWKYNVLPLMDRWISSKTLLIHLPLDTHICVSELGQYWIR